MKNLPRFAVLLPTYNGARYLAPQLDSLLSQSVDTFVMVTRDDGSSDDTRSVIEDFREKYPQRFHIVRDNRENLGPSGNFSCLMQYTLKHKVELGLDKAYMMLCDQDDIWDKGKVAVEMQAMLEAEAENPDIPVLVHSDLVVVSEDAKPIAESFIEYQGLNARKNQLRRILLSNTVTGATALLNEELVIKSLPIPDSAIMHDWWLALVAAAFGRIEFIPEKLVAYRQHGENTLGARQWVRQKFSRSVKNLFRPDGNPLLNPLAAQARTFSSRYGSELGLSSRIRLGLASNLDSENPFRQRVMFRLLRI